LTRTRGTTGRQYLAATFGLGLAGGVPAWLLLGAGHHLAALMVALTVGYLAGALGRR
jgi:hypothetical protein